MIEITKKNVKKGLYSISTDGKVYSHSSKRFMKSSLDKDGYLRVSLRSESGKYTTAAIHRLLMESYREVPDMDNLQVNHLDGDKQNNSLENLEWCTVEENLKHARDTGLNISNYNSKITIEEVEEVKSLYRAGVSTSEILRTKPHLTKNILNGIKSGRTWSSEEDFKNVAKSKKYSLGQIELICQLIVQGENQREISLKVFGAFEQKYAQLISDIKRGRRNRVISKKYF